MPKIQLNVTVDGFKTRYKLEILNNLINIVKSFENLMSRNVSDKHKFNSFKNIFSRWIYLYEEINNDVDENIPVGNLCRIAENFGNYQGLTLAFVDSCIVDYNPEEKDKYNFINLDLTDNIDYTTKELLNEFKLLETKVMKLLSAFKKYIVIVKFFNAECNKENEQEVVAPSAIVATLKEYQELKEYCEFVRRNLILLLDTLNNVVCIRLGLRDVDSIKQRVQSEHIEKIEHMIETKENSIKFYIEKIKDKNRVDAFNAFFDEHNPIKHNFDFKRNFALLLDLIY